MKKYLIFSFIFFLALGALVLPNGAIAQTNAEDDIQYPVKELNNCANKENCRKFCDNSANINACLAFAKKNNLMSAEEISMAEKFMAADDTPGGCTSKESCEAYCDDIGHINECITFAEKNNIIPASELAEAKKVQSAIARGVKPPACGNKKSCDTYCEDPSHMRECITFASEAGFLQGQELEDAQKMLQALQKGVKPPSCRGKEECDAYCSQEANFEECATFAEAAGFMSPEDAAMARKTKGKGPGGCRGKEECEAFCQSPANQETCYNFARDNGMLSQEQMERGPGMNPERTMGPEGGEGFMKEGPGGCKSPEECRAYCQNNPDECKNFGPGPGDSSYPQPQMMPGESGRFIQPNMDPNMPPPPEGTFQMPPMDQQQMPMERVEFMERVEPTERMEPIERMESGSYQPAPEPAPEPTSMIQLFMANVLMGFQGLR